MIQDNKRIIVALDFPTVKEAIHLADQLDPSRCRLKVGKELFTREGPGIVEKLQGKGFEIFLDLKFHDIPNTTAAACTAAAELGVWMVNIHAMGGRQMMEAAREAIDKSAHQPLLIGVTVLTSMGESDLNEIGLSTDPAEQVMRLAKLARGAGLDGLVCSALETSLLRQEFGPDFVLVTPGIRPAGSDAGDQKRTMTPVEAVQAGSSFLVIGRPINRSNNPQKVFDSIDNQLKNIST